jgi:hypothetical protein
MRNLQINNETSLREKLMSKSQSVSIIPTKSDILNPIIEHPYEKKKAKPSGKRLVQKASSSQQSLETRSYSKNRLEVKIVGGSLGNKALLSPSLFFSSNKAALRAKLSDSNVLSCFSFKEIP